jgi:hypothetical protein
LLHVTILFSQLNIGEADGLNEVNWEDTLEVGAKITRKVVSWEIEETGT